MEQGGEKGHDSPIQDVSEKQTLTPEQTTAIALRFQGQKLEAISERVGVCTRTLARWFQEPHIKAALQSEDAELRRRFAMQATNAAERALSTLTSVAENPNAPAAARVTAATKLIEIAGLAAPLKIAGHDGGPLDIDHSKAIMRLYIMRPDLRAHIEAVAEAQAAEDKAQTESAKT